MSILKGRLVSGGKYVACCCPFCEETAGKEPDTKYHLYIAKDKWVLCYRCGYKTSYAKFAKSYQVSVDDALLEDYNTEIKPKVEAKSEILSDIMMEFNDSMFSQSALAYLERRKLNNNLIRRFNIKLGLDKLFGRVVFYDKFQNYYVGRAFLPMIEPKTLNTHSENVVKPLMYFRKGNYSRIYLVEGTFDMTPFFKTGRTVFAMLGKNPSPHQLMQLSACNINEVVVALDPDAIDDAVKLCAELSTILPMANIGMYVYNTGEYRDPSDLDVELFSKVKIDWTRVMTQLTGDKT